jgi:hypothetical protein
MTERDLLVLVAWLTGLGLMLWRSPGGARPTWSIAVAGAVVWCALPLWEPALRTLWHFGVTAWLLFAALVRRWPRPAVGA